MYTWHCLPYPRFTGRRKPRKLGLPRHTHIMIPKPLKARKRPLTPPLQPKHHFWSLPQKITPQINSTLFTKLPLEIRTLIWKKAVGEMTIHLTLSGGHLLQDEENPLRFWVPCSNLLSLVLTCRQAYSEAINLLYSTNTFAFDIHGTFLYLHQLVLPQRFSQISSIRLSWWPGFSPVAEIDSWTAIWNSLASLPGLKELRVEIEVLRMWEENWASNEVRMFEIAAVVKRPKVFCIFTSWPGEPWSIAGAPHCEVFRVRENWRSDGQVWPEGYVMNI